jgi:CRP/FNR family cyclic AMP-dependent transcriptional regulator
MPDRNRPAEERFDCRLKQSRLSIQSCSWPGSRPEKPGPSCAGGKSSSRRAIRRTPSFHIEKGKIELRVSSQQGKEAILAILDVGDFFGEGCLIGQPLRMATAAAATECSVMRLEKSAMVAVLRDEPVFAALFITHLLTRNVRIEEDVVDQLFNSSEKLLARLLLLLANFGKDGKPEPVIPKVSQETLAEMIGTTRSRVSFFMNKFRKLGFIGYNGGLSVDSSLLNVVLHD